MRTLLSAIFYLVNRWDSSFKNKKKIRKENFKIMMQQDRCSACNKVIDEKADVRVKNYGYCVECWRSAEDKSVDVFNFNITDNG